MSHVDGRCRLHWDSMQFLHKVKLLLGKYPKPYLYVCIYIYIVHNNLMYLNYQSWQLTHYILNIFPYLLFSSSFWLNKFVFLALFGIVCCILPLYPLCVQTLWIAYTHKHPMNPHENPNFVRWGHLWFDMAMQAIAHLVPWITYGKWWFSVRELLNSQRYPEVNFPVWFAKLPRSCLAYSPLQERHAIRSTLQLSASGQVLNGNGWVAGGCWDYW
jgi:hypothetical protein